MIESSLVVASLMPVRNESIYYYITNFDQAIAHKFFQTFRGLWPTIHSLLTIRLE